MFFKVYQNECNLVKMLCFLCVCFCAAIYYYFVSGSEVNASDGYDTYWNMAVELHKKNRSLESEGILSELINKNPNEAKLHIMRAKFRQKYMGNYSGAILDYNVAAKLAPKTYPEIYWYRGMCLYELQLYQQAIRDYSNALQMKPRWG